MVRAEDLLTTDITLQIGLPLYLNPCTTLESFVEKEREVLYAKTVAASI